MNATVKDIASTLGIEETTVRSVISLAGLRPRGEGPKPTRGVAPKLYLLDDVKSVLDMLKNFKQAD